MARFLGQIELYSRPLKSHLGGLLRGRVVAALEDGAQKAQPFTFCSGGGKAGPKYGAQEIQPTGPGSAVAEGRAWWGFSTVWAEDWAVAGRCAEARIASASAALACFI